MATRILVLAMLFPWTAVAAQDVGVSLPMIWWTLSKRWTPKSDTRPLE